MTAHISRAAVVGGHDGRAEIEVEITYDNGGTAMISLDEEACTASLDAAGVTSIDELVGRPWSAVLPAFGPSPNRAAGTTTPGTTTPATTTPATTTTSGAGKPHASASHSSASHASAPDTTTTSGGTHHVGPRHP